MKLLDCTCLFPALQYYTTFTIHVKMNLCLYPDWSHYLLSLHPLCMSNWVPSATLFPPPCGWIHFREPRWTKEPGPSRLVVPEEEIVFIILLVFSVTPFKIDQNKKSKPFNRLSPESGKRKKINLQRLSPSHSNFSYGRYAKKRFPQIYRDSAGD